MTKQGLRQDTCHTVGKEPDLSYKDKTHPKTIPGFEKIEGASIRHVDKMC